MKKILKKLENYDTNIKLEYFVKTENCIFEYVIPLPKI